MSFAEHCEQLQPSCFVNRPSNALGFPYQHGGGQAAFEMFVDPSLYLIGSASWLDPQKSTVLLKRAVTAFADLLSARVGA